MSKALDNEVQHYEEMDAITDICQESTNDTKASMADNSVTGLAMEAPDLMRGKSPEDEPGTKVSHGYMERGMSGT